MRKIIATDLVGKTIESIDNTSVNVLSLTFSDGTTLDLWAQDAVWTRSGYIPGIFVESPEYINYKSEE